MDDWYLVIDQGGTSSRAAIFNSMGKLVELVSQPVDTQFPAPDRVEQVAHQVLDSVNVCLQNLAHKLGKNICQVRSAALVTQRSSIVCWNKQSSEVLSPVLSWQDRRAEQLLNDIGLNARWVREKTGLFPNAHFGASKIRWCLEFLPKVQSAEQAGELIIAPIAAWLSSALLRERPLAVDSGNAARTMLCNLKKGDWDDELLQRFGIPRAILPGIYPNSRLWGSLVFGGKTIPVQFVNGDQCAAFNWLASSRSGQVVINAGTGAFVAVPLSGEADAPPRLLHSLVFDDGKYKQFVAEGTVNGAGSALAWIESKTGYSIDDCRDINNHIPLFMNGVGGLGSPYWQPGFPSRFIGAGSKKSRVIAVLESIVFLVKRNLEELEHITNSETMIVSGGLSRLDLFCQKLANLAQRPVARQLAVEATARGAAWQLAGRPDWSIAEAVFRPVGTDDLIHSRYRQWCKEMSSRQNSGS